MSRIIILFSLNVEFLTADGIYQNRLGNNRHILKLNNRTVPPSDLAFEIMAKMKNSEAGEKVLKKYFRMFRTKTFNPSRLALYRKHFKY